MRVEFSANAVSDLDGMDASVRRFFLNHAGKLSRMPPRRHLRFGLPYCVEDVTRQARLIYTVDAETLYVIRCFATHEAYEKWFKAFK